MILGPITNWLVEYELCLFHGDEPDDYESYGFFTCTAQAPYAVEWDCSGYIIDPLQTAIEIDIEQREEYWVLVQEGGSSRRMEKLFRDRYQALQNGETQPPLDPRHETSYALFEKIQEDPNAAVLLYGVDVQVVGAAAEDPYEEE